jgi:hypothetical protein
MAIEPDEIIRADDFVSTSSGASDEGKVVKLNAEGQVPHQFLPTKPLDIQDFSAGGDWTKPDQGTLAMVELWGAGASGAATCRSSSGTYALASGGGGGAYVRFIVPIDFLNTTEAVTIGNGGASVSVSTQGAVSGNSGGATSFKGISANGGVGGIGFIETSSTVTYAGGAGGAVNQAPAFGGQGGGNGGDARWNTGGTNGVSSFYSGAGGGASNAGSSEIKNTNGGTCSILGTTGGNGAGATGGVGGTACGGAGAARYGAGDTTSGAGGNGFARITVF